MPDDTRHCWAPEDMIRAVDLPLETLRTLVISAAQVALAEEQVVTVLGASPGYNGHFCRMRCRFEHPGSVLVLPDLGVVESHHHGERALDRLQFISGRDGRSVAICAVA